MTCAAPLALASAAVALSCPTGGWEANNVKEFVEDITSVLFIIAAGGLGFFFIAVALR